MSNYPYLKDVLAIHEIRKHQWLESEKTKKEIGFPTAAMDWIQRYGESWKAHRLQNLQHNEDVFIERRNWRRFNLVMPFQLETHDTVLHLTTFDFSVMGIAFTIPKINLSSRFVNIYLELNRIIGDKAHPSAFRFPSQLDIDGDDYHNDSDHLRTFAMFPVNIQNILKGHYKDFVRNIYHTPAPAMAS